VIAPVIAAASFQPTFGRAPVAFLGGFGERGNVSDFGPCFRARNAFRKCRVAAVVIFSRSYCPEPCEERFVSDTGVITGGAARVPSRKHFYQCGSRFGR